jgi:chromosome segregation ATPase
MTLYTHTLQGGAGGAQGGAGSAFAGGGRGSSGGGGRGGAGGSGSGLDIREEVIKRSKYGSKNLSITNSSVGAKNVLGTGGEEVTDRRNDLERRIHEAKAARDETDHQLRAKNDEINALMQEISQLKSTRMQIQRALGLPKELERKRAADVRKRDEIGKRLAGDIIAEREQKKAAYAKSIDQLVQCMEGLIKAATECSEVEVEKAVAAYSKRELREAIMTAASALEDAKNGLRQLKVNVKEAQFEREKAQREFAEAEDRLKVLQEKHGGGAGFQQLYIKVR